MSRTFFDGSELGNEDFKEALAKDSECWPGDTLDPVGAAAAAAAVTVVLAMAYRYPRGFDRLDVVLGNLEASSETPAVFSRYRWKRHGLAHVTTEALVAGLKPRATETKVGGVLDLVGDRNPE